MVELDAPIGPASGPREAAELTRDLAVMVDRLRTTIDERARAAAVAEGARQDMQRFMADTSHELRTPLTALRGYSDLYERGALDADGVDRAMKRIGAESRRLTDLADDLLSLLRPVDVELLDQVDLGAVASAVVEDVRAAYRSHPVTLDLSGADGCVVTGNADRLHQAMLNVAANACRHTPARTPVRVAVSRRPTTDGELVDGPIAAEVTISDDGPGLDGDNLDDLFKPFVRTEASRSRHGQSGAGLGLTITHRVVEQHRGRIAMTSSPGVGTTVTIRIPVVGGPENRPSPPVGQ